MAGGIMNIVISGIGKFGKELVEHLAKENHNIVVIDPKASVIEEMVNQHDVKGICGNDLPPSCQHCKATKNAPRQVEAKYLPPIL